MCELQTTKDTINYTDVVMSSLKSDGRWVEGSIYGLDTLRDRTGVDISEIAGKNWAYLYEIVGPTCIEHSLKWWGIDLSTISLFSKLSSELDELSLEPRLKEMMPKGIGQAYYNNLDLIWKQIADLKVFRSNMHVASFSWKPFRHLHTPQCGEQSYHKKLVEIQLDILKKQVKKIEDD